MKLRKFKIEFTLNENGNLEGIDIQSKGFKIIELMACCGALTNFVIDKATPDGDKERALFIADLMNKSLINNIENDGTKK